MKTLGVDALASDIALAACVSYVIINENDRISFEDDNFENHGLFALFLGLPRYLIVEMMEDAGKPAGLPKLLHSIRIAILVLCHFWTDTPEVDPP